MASVEVPAAYAALNGRTPLLRHGEAAPAVVPRRPADRHRSLDRRPEPPTSAPTSPSTTPWSAGRPGCSAPETASAPHAGRHGADLRGAAGVGVRFGREQASRRPSAWWLLSALAITPDGSLPVRLDQPQWRRDRRRVRVRERTDPARGGSAQPGASGAVDPRLLARLTIAGVAPGRSPDRSRRSSWSASSSPRSSSPGARDTLRRLSRDRRVQASLRGGPAGRARVGGVRHGEPLGQRD